MVQEPDVASPAPGRTGRRSGPRPWMHDVSRRKFTLTFASWTNEHRDTAGSAGLDLQRCGCSGEGHWWALRLTKVE